MDINKRILADMGYVSREEQQELMKIYELSKHEPQTKLILSIMRDIYAFRSMVNATVIRNKETLRAFERRIEKIEEKLGINNL